MAGKGCHSDVGPRPVLVSCKAGRLQASSDSAQRWCLLGCRDKVGELLSQVCSGVGTQEMSAALQGLLAAAAHVRAAAITAMLDVPAFAEGACPLLYVVSRSSSLAYEF